MNAYLTLRYLKLFLVHDFWTRTKAAFAVLGAFTGTWKIVETTYKNTPFIKCTEQNLSGLFGLFVFLVVPLLLSWIFTSPKLRVRSKKISGKNATIEVTVQNVFEAPKDAVVVVPVNHCFDMTMGGNVEAASNSVQKVLLTKEFGSDGYALQHAVDNVLKERKLRVETDGKRTKHPYGTTICITKSDHTRKYLLVATTGLNEHRRAQSTYGDLETALAVFWHELRDKHSKAKLYMPVIGTGNARNSLSIERSIEQIIVSFFDALGEGEACDKLVICVYPPSFEEKSVDIARLNHFMSSRKNFFVDTPSSG